ncbi:MAG: LuxR C-terminal-related transcriptional regulator [Ktedonobacteraceae bacterium]
MPKPSTPLLHWSEEYQNYELSTDGRPKQRFVSDDGSKWISFLETHTSFSFRGREGQLSVIKETRLRGTGYWYAYRSSGRRTAKRYLGLSKNVTFSHLEDIASTLTHASHGRQITGENQDTVAPLTPPFSLLLSKLLPPRLPSSLVARPHLMQQLDAALERKLTLLVAPPGFGKTTVVVQWMNERRAQGRPVPTAWVSLDNGDNDLFRFWRSIITACQTFQKNLGQTALAFLADVLQPPFVSLSMETALTLLLNDIAQHVPGGLLILDDYHAIKESAIHEALTFFIDHLPPAISVLMMTRAEPLHLPLLRWHASGDISELHSTDLRFSPEETATFVRQKSPTQLSDTAIKQIDTSLQGWVAGLRLLTLSLLLSANKTRHEQMASTTIEQALASLNLHSDASSPYQPLLDYFVTEILNAQPEHLQLFLLQTSVLSLLSGSLCNVVTGEEDSAVKLATVEQDGLFLEALDGTWYRFHALFAEAMRREAILRLGEESLHVLSLRASQWYEQHSMIQEAIEAALLAHDFEHAALLIEQMGADEHLTELYSVGQWLEQIPEAILSTHPMLCWLAALSLLAFQEEASISEEESRRIEALLQMAGEGWRQQRKQSLLGLVAAIHAMRAWRSALFPHAMEYAQEALTLLLDDEQDRHIQMFHGVCLFIVGTGFMYEGRFVEARSSFLEGHRFSLIGDDRHFKRSLLLLVGACSYILGELQQAHEYYQQALSDARRQTDREVTARALLGLSNIAFEWNELARAEQQANEVLTLALEEKVDIRNSAFFQLALLSYARGQIASAGQQLATLMARLQVTATPQSVQELPNVLIWQARLSLETGDPRNAAAILETLDLEEHLTSRIFQARLLLTQSKPQEAFHQLECLLPVAQGWHDALEIQILMALAHAACKESEQARERLRQVLSQAHRDGFVRLFLSEGEPLVRLLRQVLPTLREPALRSYAQTILHAFTTTMGTDVHSASSSHGLLIDPLSAQEYRVLRLLVAGRSNPEIAQELVVSVNTVKGHVKHLYRKLGVSNRLQASETARLLNLC